MQKYGTQVVVAQTAFTPVILLELLDAGKMCGYKGNPEAGVHNPEEYVADDFVALMPDYEFPAGSWSGHEYKRNHDHVSLINAAK